VRRLLTPHPAFSHPLPTNGRGSSRTGPQFEFRLRQLELEGRVSCCASIKCNYLSKYSNPFLEELCCEQLAL